MDCELCFFSFFLVFPSPQPTPPPLFIENTMTGQMGWLRLWCMHTTKTNRGWAYTESEVGREKKQKLTVGGMRGGGGGDQWLEMRPHSQCEGLDNLLTTPRLWCQRVYALTRRLFSEFIFFSLSFGLSRCYPSARTNGTKGLLAYCFSSKKLKKTHMYLTKMHRFLLFLLL